MTPFIANRVNMYSIESIERAASFSPPHRYRSLVCYLQYLGYLVVSFRSNHRSNKVMELKIPYNELPCNATMHGQAQHA